MCGGGRVCDERGGVILKVAKASKLISHFTFTSDPIEPRKKKKYIGDYKNKRPYIGVCR